jgi:phosphohistidine phosphatase
MSSRHRLIVMRHAKAEPFAATDHERPLTERGRRNAAEAGNYLARTSIRPDHALVSSATRAVATWEAFAAASGTCVGPDIDDAVFTGSPDVVLDALRRVPEAARCVSFVGHNPTAAYLVHLLDDGNGDPDVVAQLLQGFPAGALAVLDTESPWSELGAASCRLVDFHVGSA